MIECMCGVVFAHERCRQVLQGGGGAVVNSVSAILKSGTDKIKSGSAKNEIGTATTYARPKGHCWSDMPEWTLRRSGGKTSRSVPETWRSVPLPICGCAA